MTHSVEEIVRAALADILALPPVRVDGFRGDTPLFGALPEFDSMAVAVLLEELEERLEIRIDDDEVSGDLFATFGSLLRFAQAKSPR